MGKRAACDIQVLDRLVARQDANERIHVVRVDDATHERDVVQFMRALLKKL